MSTFQKQFSIYLLFFIILCIFGLLSAALVCALKIVSIKSTALAVWPLLACFIYVTVLAVRKMRDCNTADSLPLLLVLGALTQFYLMKKALVLRAEWKPAVIYTSAERFEKRDCRKRLINGYGNLGFYYMRPSKPIRQMYRDFFFTSPDYEYFSSSGRHPVHPRDLSPTFSCPGA